MKKGILSLSLILIGTVLSYSQARTDTPASGTPKTGFIWNGSGYGGGSCCGFEWNTYASSGTSPQIDYTPITSSTAEIDWTGVTDAGALARITLNSGDSYSATVDAGPNNDPRRIGKVRLSAASAVTVTVEVSNAFSALATAQSFSVTTTPTDFNLDFISGSGSAINMLIFRVPAGLTGLIRIHRIEIGTSTSTTTSILRSESVVANTSVYPNPTSGVSFAKFTLKTPSETSMIVSNSMGKEVINKTLGMLPAGENTAELNLTSFEKGVYYLSFRINGELSKPEKIIIN